MFNHHFGRRSIPRWAALAVVLAAIAVRFMIVPSTLAEPVKTAADSAAPTESPAPSQAPAEPAAQPDPDATPPAEHGATVPSERWVDVDLSRQRVDVREGDQVIRSMVASSGAPGYDTPQGTFTIQNRGEWFYSQKYQEGARWWVSFKDWGTYLFHSVVMDENQKIIPEEAAKLGTPASHGCLRLAEADARWIYDNLPEGTRVVIHA